MDDFKSESVEDILEKNRTYIELLSQVNNSLVWILERTTGTYLYLSPNFSDYIDCDLSELKKRQPLEFITRYIHPDDLPVLIDMQNHFFGFVSDLSYKEQLNYKHIFEFRALHKGNWIRVTDQRQLLGISSDNKPVILGIVDISPNQELDQAVNYRLVNFKTGKIVSFEPNQNTGVTVTELKPHIDNYNTVDVETIFAKNKPFIESMVRMNNRNVYVVEKKNNTLLYLSPDFYKFWEYDPSSPIVKESREYLLRRLHPDDIAVFTEAQDKIIEYLSTLSGNDRLNYKYISEFRALHKGVWRRIISQHWLLGISSDGTAVVIGIVDISPNQKSNQTFSLQLINNNTGEIAPFAIRENTINNPLSKRELEILKMASEGMLSKEISEKLSISIHTVNGHRQNILQKMNVQNLQEAIYLARMQGLLA
ncbi:MAG: LuxR C-terminal-related transcriptional regulator [Prevotella sp.]|jgi:DNA-binding CsgD family transcriptional regulator/DNA-directed RNA polymerase subunit F|nr:LuxR C-terminal-related transcriptional regulator [Prevotella sp.]